MAMKKSVWDMILKVVIAVASAVAGWGCEIERNYSDESGTGC